MQSFVGIVDAGRIYAIGLLNISSRLAEFSVNESRLLQLREMAGQFQKKLDMLIRRDTDFPTTLNTPHDNITSANDHFNILRGRIIEAEKTLQAQFTKSQQLEQLTHRIESALDGLNSLAEESIDDVKRKFNATEAYLSDKQMEVEAVVGFIAAKSIVGSYEKSAEVEEKSADDLRQLAVAFMIFVMAFVGWTFYEITTNKFTWEQSALKLICSLLFSVPAAYLARESAKHRQQQYTHLQTALDLKAIGPYIATLEKTVQDEIKLDIAKKIFTPKTFEHVTKESYPVNTQELILALVDKIKSADSGKTKS